jgi:hypothetical protein
MPTPYPFVRRFGGGFAAISPPRGDPLAALEAELRTSYETIRTLRARVSSLEAETDRRSAAATEHSRARGALQAEVAEAQRFVAKSAAVRRDLPRPPPH